MSKSQVQEFFGVNADKYATSKVHAKGASLERVVELVRPKPEWRALDVATAAGHTAFVFAPHVTHVIATDITPEMLSVAQKVGEEKGIDNVSFQEADAENLPFDDASFDLVTCRIAPHHFSNIGRFLRESARVLRTGGLLALIDNVSPDHHTTNADAESLRQAADYYNQFEKLRDQSHGRCLSLDEWLFELNQAGFQIVHHELASKEMEFQSWVDRFQITKELTERLREMLMVAPDVVTEFLRPQIDGEEIKFYLTEAIIVARK